jgi:hypothetical protein
MTRLLLFLYFALMLIGLLGYFTADGPHVTALIPSVFSIFFASLFRLYSKNKMKLKTWYISVVILSILMLAGTWRALFLLSDLGSDSTLNSSAIIARAVTAIVTIISFGLTSRIYLKRRSS